MPSRATLKIRPERPIEDFRDTYALGLRFPMDHPNEWLLDMVRLARCAPCLKGALGPGP
jgi:hypothetical protein